jgi:GNAT superfamily N-acetyltransferase
METIQSYSTLFEHAEATAWARLYHPHQKLPVFTDKFAGGIAGAVPGIDILAFNRVVGIGLERPVREADLDAIISFFQEAGASRFFVQVAPFAQPAGLTDLLATKGFRHHNNWAKLSRPLAVPPAPPAASPLTVREVEKWEGTEYGKLIVEAFDWPDDLVDLFASSVGQPGYSHFFALLQGKPIAAAALHVAGEIGSMAMAGTLPAYRGLGAQKQLLHRRLEVSRQRGCTYSVSETGEDLPEKPNLSYRNMLTLGFKQEYLRKNYLYSF